MIIYNAKFKTKLRALKTNIVVAYWLLIYNLILRPFTIILYKIKKPKTLYDRYVRDGIFVFVRNLLCKLEYSSPFPKEFYRAYYMFAKVHKDKPNEYIFDNGEKYEGDIEKDIKEVPDPWKINKQLIDSFMICK